MRITRCALSVFLTVSLLSPSLAPLPLLAQAQPGSPENPSNKPSEQGEGGGSGTDAAAEAEATGAQMAADINSGLSLAGGLTGPVGTVAPSTNFDPNNPSFTFTTDNGVTVQGVTPEQAYAVAETLGAARDAGINIAPAPGQPGVDVAATLEAHSQGETGVVVGSMSGEIGTPAEVARAEIAAAARQGAVSALTDAAFDSRWGGAAVVQGNDLNQALAAAYGQMANSARQAGILNLGGTIQVGPGGNVNAQYTMNQSLINSYQQYASVMGQSGNLSLSGTTNTSYTWDNRTESWTGNQNGRSYSTAEMLSTNAQMRDTNGNADPAYVAQLESAAKQASGINNVLGVNFSANLITSLDTVSGRMIGMDINTNETRELIGVLQSYDSTSGTNLGQTPPAGTAFTFTPTGLGSYQIASTKTVAPKESFVGAYDTKLSNSAARSMLDGNVTVKDGVSFEGARASTVATVNLLANDCNCNVPITSVTDGRHAPGTHSHGNGAKFDVSNWRSPEFTEYVTGGKNGWTQTGSRGGAHGGPVYTNPAYPGVNIVHEKSYNHFDIQVTGDVGKAGLEIDYATGSIFEGSLHNDLPPGESLAVDLPSIPGSGQSTGSQNETPSQSGSTPAPDISRSLPDVVADGMSKVGIDPNSGIGKGVMGLVGLADNVLGRFGIDFNDLINGGTAPGNGVDTQDAGDATCPYPLSCEDEDSDLSASVIMALSPGIHVLDWALQIWGLILGDRNTQPLAVSQEIKATDTVLVEIVARLSDNTIEVHRPDIEATLTNPDSHYTKNQYDQLVSLLSEEPILMGPDGSIAYSNGLYSPPVKNGQLVGTPPKYVYVLKQIDENGNEVETNGTVEAEGLLARMLRQVFGESSPFGIDMVSTVTYRLVEPDMEIPGDEYYDYVFTLKDGSHRATVVPQFSSITQMTNNFRNIGYQGSSLDILALAVETSELPERSLAGKLLDWIKDSSNRFLPNPTDDPTVTTLPEITQKYSVDDISNIFIYPNAAVGCPDVEGYEQGYMYTATINDPERPGYMTLITDGRCGNGDEVEYMMDALQQLEDQWGLAGTFVESTVTKVHFRFEETPYNPGLASVYVGIDQSSKPTELEDTTPTEPAASSTTTQLPNLTNTITFEVKAVGSNGAVLADWSQAEKITIAPGVQLYFRWNGSDYNQCLPFLNDNGNYSLTVRNRAMTTGNTESEGYNINERGGIYRVECGGQRNNEFGVDSREIEVVVQ